MSNNFINIIKEATEFYTKHKDHPAAKDELIGIVGEALEKMDEEEILSFDEWFSLLICVKTSMKMNF